jgi:hypothetical protein
MRAAPAIACTQPRNPPSSCRRRTPMSRRPLRRRQCATGSSPSSCPRSGVTRFRSDAHSARGAGVGARHARRGRLCSASAATASELWVARCLVASWSAPHLARPAPSHLLNAPTAVLGPCLALFRSDCRLPAPQAQQAQALSAAPQPAPARGPRGGSNSAGRRPTSGGGGGGGGPGRGASNTNAAAGRGQGPSQLPGRGAHGAARRPDPPSGPGPAEPPAAARPSALQLPSSYSELLRRHEQLVAVVAACGGQEGGRGD